MKSLIAAVIAGLAPTVAPASGFASCDLRGAIRSVAQTDAGYVVTVSVTDATRGAKNGDAAYTDCSDHLGRETTLTLTGAAVPAVGDHLTFSRSAVDGYGADGAFAGTTTVQHLIKLNRRKP